jgi:hypothetical protein
MTHQAWYSVRSVFRSDTTEDGEPRRAFEERVVLFRATSFEEALAKGEAEARGYASDILRGVMLDHVVACHIHDDDLSEGDEVWSCVRDLDTSDEQFLRQVYAGELESFANVHSRRHA